MAADLGDDLSAQERTLLDVAAVNMAVLAVADAWLKENAGSVVNRGGALSCRSWSSGSAWTPR